MKCFKCPVPPELLLAMIIIIMTSHLCALSQVTYCILPQFPHLENGTDSIRHK